MFFFFSCNSHSNRFLLSIFLASLFFGAGAEHTCNAAQPVHTAKTRTPFPLYAEIADNVQFWENIYDRYANTSLLVHDREDVRKIYAEISLLDPEHPGAREKNALAEKKIRKTYENILKQLASAPPRNSTERRIAAFFAGTNKSQDLHKAAQQIRTQNGQKQRFRKSVIRSGAYLENFKEIFRSYHLPEDLAYLPHVESSFHPGAYSKAGAVGIWQFTRATGKRYLIIDDAVDERLDPIAATHAAAKYFLLAHKYLKNWPLTITSYNYGLPGTIRAKDEFGSYRNVFNNHRTGIFQFAARNFYPEFLAARTTAKKLEKTLQLNNAEQTLNLKLTGYLNLSDVTSYFRITAKELKRLNPALLPPVFEGSRRITRGYTLHLPATPAMRQRIAAFPQRIYYASQRQTQYYKVRKGDTISGIAAQLGITAHSLQQANKINEHGLIRVNQRLRIPARTGTANKLPPEIRRSETGQKRLSKETIPVLQATRKKHEKLERNYGYHENSDRVETTTGFLRTCRNDSRS